MTTTAISPDTLAHHKADIIIALARAFVGERIDFAYPTQTIPPRTGPW